ncbi:MAG: hypothetical protein Q8O88_00575 [bacterium]|nr:hypothetical protein [bacterium]
MTNYITKRHGILISLVLLFSFFAKGQREFSSFNTDNHSDSKFENFFHEKYDSIDSDTIIALKYSHFKTKFHAIGIIIWKQNNGYRIFTVRESRKNIIQSSKRLSRKSRMIITKFFENEIYLLPETNCANLELTIEGEGGGFYGAVYGEIFIKARVGKNEWAIETREMNLGLCKNDTSKTSIDWIEKICWNLEKHDM